MPPLLRVLLLVVFGACLIVVEHVAWYYLRARRLHEGRGDIGAAPIFMGGGLGLPWQFGPPAIVIGAAALVGFVHG